MIPGTTYRKPDGRTRTHLRTAADGSVIFTRSELPGEHRATPTGWALIAASCPVVIAPACADPGVAL